LAHQNRGSGPRQPGYEDMRLVCDIAAVSATNRALDVERRFGDRPIGERQVMDGARPEAIAFL
jgi:hypothetical protein